nr:DNA-invertase hin [Providencia stuartii]
MQGQRIGYVRVSSFDQNPERQLEGVQVARVFTDKASGKDTQRPELERLLAFVREGDTVVVHSMDRLARNLDDLRRIVQGLTQRGVRMEFVKEGLKFTGEDSPMANLMLSVMGAFAEFERALIRERQREGIVLAKQRGAYRGRKKSLNSEQIAELKRRVAAGDQKTLVARDFGISRETLYQYLREDWPCHAAQSCPPPSAKACWHCQMPKTNWYGTTRSTKPTCRWSVSVAAPRIDWASLCSFATCDSLAPFWASMSLRFRPCCAWWPRNSRCQWKVGASTASANRHGGSTWSSCKRFLGSSPSPWATIGKPCIHWPSWPCRPTKASCWRAHLSRICGGRALSCPPWMPSSAQAPRPSPVPTDAFTRRWPILCYHPTVSAWTNFSSARTAVKWRGWHGCASRLPNRTLATCSNILSAWNPGKHLICPQASSGRFTRTACSKSLVKVARWRLLIWQSSRCNDAMPRW